MNTNMNISNPTYYSRERSEALVSVNYLLNRPKAVRNPVDLCQILHIYEELQNFIAPEKLYVIDRLYETGYNASICVCQLAGCCSKSKICKYCQHTMQWLHYIGENPKLWDKQDTMLHVTTYWTNGTDSVKTGEVYKINCKLGEYCENKECQFTHH